MSLLGKQHRNRPKISPAMIPPTTSSSPFNMFIHVEPAGQTQHIEQNKIELKGTEQNRKERCSPVETCREGDSEAGGEPCYGQNVVKTPCSHQQGGDPLNNNTERY